jgi:hypothetical protein
MSKLFLSANKSWWVPESAPQRLAVQLLDPERYLEAVTQKVQALVDKAGGEQAAMELVNPVLLELGQSPLEPGEPVAEALVAMEPLATLVRDADPEVDSPAPREVAAEAVKAQDQLELLTLLL